MKVTSAPDMKKMYVFSIVLVVIMFLTLTNVSFRHTRK